jgi:type II secretion system protein G
MFKAAKVFKNTIICLIILGMVGCGNREEQGTAPKPNPLNERKSPQEILANKDSDQAVETALTFYVSGIFLFHLHCRALPTTEQGLKSLVEKPKEYEGLWNGPYSELFNDPWGHPYQYKLVRNEPFPFDLRSLGPDGIESGDDIIASKLPSLRELAKGFNENTNW